MSRTFENGATVADLAALLTIQPASIVSRTLMKGPGGSATLFAFDRGQELSEHTSPFAALLQVLSGTARVTIGGEPFTVNGGEAILMPADVPHAVAAPEPFTMLLGMVRGAGGKDE